MKGAVGLGARLGVVPAVRVAVRVDRTDTAEKRVTQVGQAAARAARPARPVARVAAAGRRAAGPAGLWAPRALAAATQGPVEHALAPVEALPVPAVLPALQGAARLAVAARRAATAAAEAPGHLAGTWVARVP